MLRVLEGSSLGQAVGAFSGMVLGNQSQAGSPVLGTFSGCPKSGFGTCTGGSSPGGSGHPGFI